MKLCEYCEKLSVKRKTNRFCSRSCSNAWQHKHGIRRTYVNDKTVWQWWVSKFGEEEARRRLEIAKERNSRANSGDSNAMFGKHDHIHGLMKFHSEFDGKTWDEMYGSEKASARRHALSQRMSGTKNPAYGKVYRHGGVGLQGKYKGIVFRSTWELSFLFEQLNKGIHPIAEPVAIPYEFNQKQRTYHPDFQINNVIIEIKPTAFLCDSENIAKFIAAILYCREHGMMFEILTERSIKKLSTQEILTLVDVEWNKGAFERLRAR